MRDRAERRRSRLSRTEKTHGGSSFYGIALPTEAPTALRWSCAAAFFISPELESLALSVRKSACCRSAWERATPDCITDCSVIHHPLKDRILINGSLCNRRFSSAGSTPAPSCTLSVTAYVDLALQLSEQTSEPPRPQRTNSFSSSPPSGNHPSPLDHPRNQEHCRTCLN